MKCHLGQKVSIKEYEDCKGYLSNISNLIINVSESNLPSMWDCLCGSKSGQKLQTCSEVLLSFLNNLLISSQSKYIKNPSFSHSNFLPMQRGHLVPFQTMKVLVTGSPGVGKTTLLQALADSTPCPVGFLTLEVMFQYSSNCNLSLLFAGAG